jgi:hypothetical protein
MAVRGNRRFCVRDLNEDALSALCKFAARVGRRHAARCAIDELRSEFGFDARNASAHDGLGQTETARSLHESAAPDHFDECFYVI